MGQGAATVTVLSTGAKAVVGAALSALVASAALAGLNRFLERRLGRRPAMDWQGAVVAVGLVGAAYATAKPDLARLGIVALAAAPLLIPTDWIRGPRGLRALVALAAVLTLASDVPLIDTVKLPFSTHFVTLGWAGWLVSWIWVALFGSMFARAGIVAGVAPGLAVLAGTTLWAICVLRPEATGETARLSAVALAGAGLGTGPFQRYLRTPACSAGAYLVGMVCGIVAAMGMMKDSALLALLLPLLLIGMPLFAVVGPRARAAKTEGRPRHLHEVLLEEGYTEAAVAAVALAGTAYLCVLAVLLVVIIEWSWVIKLAIVGGWAVLGGGLGYIIVRVMPRPLATHLGPVRVGLFGLHLDALTMAEALERAREFIRSGTPHYVVTCDTPAVVRAQDDESFRRFVNGADLVTADGAGVVLAAKLLGLPVQVRVAGCDMVEGLCRVAAEEGQSVYFLGAEPGVAEEAAACLRERVPGLRVAGCHHGYFRPEEEELVVAAVAAAQPGVLFVALGQPRQEQFIASNLHRIRPLIAIGIGGSLDVISGRKKRAPVWMQRLGLEWVYRVVREPWRLPRLKALPRILFMVFRELLREPRPSTPGPVAEQLGENK
ncbi:MAG: WecB/TagA/CpsF family glycosyltransferase [Armatimonadetes bacterium]|nr:WecB/TagA/CpsF family glycosyltransferase [Armatimonadota bacterium]